MEGDPVEEVEGEVRMSCFVGPHALEEPGDPELPTCVFWAITYPIELAEFRAKYLDGGGILVHGQGELEKGLRVGCDGEGFGGVWIEQLIGFIAHRPQGDGMQRRMGIDAFAQVTPRVVHVVYPVPRQLGPRPHPDLPP